MPTTVKQFTESSLEGGLKEPILLRNLISAEKAVVSSLNRLGEDVAAASLALARWGQAEGDDLGDVLGGSDELIQTFAAFIVNLAGCHQVVLDSMESVRAREEDLDALKWRRKSLGTKIDTVWDALGNTDVLDANLYSERSKLVSYITQTQELDEEIVGEQAALGVMKRQVTVKWMGLNFQGLKELCESGTIVANFGQLLIPSLSHQKNRPHGRRRVHYSGRPRTKAYLDEAQATLRNAVVLGSSAQETLKLSRITAHYASSTSPLRFAVKELTDKSEPDEATLHDMAWLMHAVFFEPFRPKPTLDFKLNVNEVTVPRTSRPPPPLSQSRKVNLHGLVDKIQTQQRTFPSIRARTELLSTVTSAARPAADNVLPSYLPIPATIDLSSSGLPAVPLPFVSLNQMEDDDRINDFDSRVDARSDKYGGSMCFSPSVCSDP